MKSVAIVGAGPAGLVAAKTLLQYAGGTKFKVTVFEAADRVGGMWRALPGEPGEKCNPHMRTNLSRFTVSFPDLSWTSVDLTDPETRTAPSSPPPMFPKAWEVGRYLEAYARRFLPTDVVQLNKKVIEADFEGAELSGAWRVTSVDTVSHNELKDSFDYLIVSSGFFENPAQGLSQTQAPNGEAHTNVQHSSKFRDISSLAEREGKIVVIGGGISGSEAAATAAFQLSSARWAPRKETSRKANSTVYHVFNRPFYCMPRYLPQDPYDSEIQGFNLSPHFLPVDLVLYNLSRRGDGLISASNGPVPPEKAKKGHEFIRSAIGGDQREIGHSELVSRPNNLRYPGFVGITDTYTEFVRSGLIVPVLGRVESIKQHSGEVSTTAPADAFSVDVVSQGLWKQADQHGSARIDNVCSVIEATGFQVHLDYLSRRIKEAIDYDSECHRVPFLLSHNSVFAPKIPSIAFVGFYEGPYWGVMANQARVIAQAWDPEAGNVARADRSDSTESSLVRQAVKNRDPSLPQFWMGDYVGLMEELSRNAGVRRDDSLFGGQTGPSIPSRYQGSDIDAEATSVAREVAEMKEQSDKKARFVAAASFRGMQGKWTLQRKIDSRHASMPGGTFKGIAQFHPRIPTSSPYTAEYLYIEEGTLIMDNGLTFPATRRYIYRYNENTDTITAWFAEEDGLTVGALFNTWEFYPPNDTFHGWFAKGSHWCSPDTYKSNCEFRFRGASLETFGITYDVVGPKKDYSHESWYSRPKLGTS